MITEPLISFGTNLCEIVRDVSRHDVCHAVAGGSPRRQIGALWPNACTVLAYPGCTPYLGPNGNGKLD